MKNVAVGKFVFVGILACGLGGRYAADGQVSSEKPPGVLLGSMIEAWQHRQDRTLTLDAQCSGICSNRPTGAVIDKDQDVNYRFCLGAKGEIRFSYTPFFYLNANGLHDNQILNIFDGRKTKIFIPGITVEGKYPLLHIRSKENAETASTVAHSLPLRLVFRPFHRQMGVFDAKKITHDGSTRVVQGQLGLLIKQGDYSVIVDPDKDYRPLRFLETDKTGVIRMIEIRYAEGNDLTLISEWTDVLSGVYASRIKIDKLDINTEISASLFDIEPPFGAYVRDDLSNELYLHRKQGKRLFTPSEMSQFGYERVLNSEPGELQSPERVMGSNWRTWYIIGGNISLLLLITILVFRIFAGKMRRG